MNDLYNQQFSCFVTNPNNACQAFHPIFQHLSKLSICPECWPSQLLPLVLRGYRPPPLLSQSLVSQRTRAELRRQGAASKAEARPVAGSWVIRPTLPARARARASEPPLSPRHLCSLPVSRAPLSCG